MRVGMPVSDSPFFIAFSVYPTNAGTALGITPTEAGLIGSIKMAFFAQKMANHGIQFV